MSWTYMVWWRIVIARWAQYSVLSRVTNPLVGVKEHQGIPLFYNLLWWLSSSLVAIICPDDGNISPYNTILQTCFWFSGVPRNVWYIETNKNLVHLCCLSMANMAKSSCINFHFPEICRADILSGGFSRLSSYVSRWLPYHLFMELWGTYK